MARRKNADLLVEVGTEELPPKALKRLMLAFGENVERMLNDQRLDHGAVSTYASPRRLAVIVEALAVSQPDREVESKGPPVKVAFDDEGNAKPAATAFAKKCGVEVADLQRTATEKGEWLSFRSREKGVAAAELLPSIIEQALQDLPVPRRMRWGASEVEFVRPVHWLMLLHGSDVVPATIMGCDAGNVTRGHRFLSKGDITIRKPAEYVSLLEKKGFVLADFAVRQQTIVEQVTAAARAAGGAVQAGAELFEEVAALTEWPVAMTGHFDEEFLELPAESIVASLTGHQRYFPVADEQGQLLSAFVVVSNLESSEPERVRDGNERVIRPRLADAAFFWGTDRKTPLSDRCDALDRVVYQKGLGSLRDKSERVGRICGWLAEQLGREAAPAERAATLAKCDLLTGMVGEFPELQGVMGSYYAAADGEPAEVADAIREQYLPRFAGDTLPATPAGQMLSLAEKLDTVAGAFALGKKPSGNKDPFGLRRAALGIVRLLVEGRLDLGLGALAQAALREQPVEGFDLAEVSEQMHGFMADRLRSYYIERPGMTVEIFDAVESFRARTDLPLPDFDRRILAVQAFGQMSEAASLAAANKRISNILQQAGDDSNLELDQSLLQEAAEIDLSAALEAALADVRPLRDSGEYEAVLARLAELKTPVDRFFDEVMVMSEDRDLQRNRLTLLARLREPFHSVADISRLSSGKSQT